MQKHPKLSLHRTFQKLPDPRINRTKDHDLVDVLIIATLALYAAESFYDMEEFGRASRLVQNFSGFAQRHSLA